MEMSIGEYLRALQSKLLHADNWKAIRFSKEWVGQAPNAAGVYVLKEGNNLVYVGETGNLKGRMRDLLDSRQHCLRRTLGEKLYSTQEGFLKATASTKFPGQFEVLLNQHMTTSLMIAYLEVPLGRKELEELIDSELCPTYRLNKRGKRKGGLDNVDAYLAKQISD